MRQIFQPFPYFLPADPEPVRRLFETTGSIRRVKKGEVLKRGGEDAKLFFLTKGLCAYQLDGTASGRTVHLAIIPPGRAMGDLTASVHAFGAGDGRRRYGPLRLQRPRRWGSVRVRFGVRLPDQ